MVTLLAGFGLHQRRASGLHGNRLCYRANFQAGVLGDHVHLQHDRPRTNFLNPLAVKLMV